MKYSIKRFSFMDKIIKKFKKESSKKPTDLIDIDIDKVLGDSEPEKMVKQKIKKNRYYKAAKAISDVI